QVFRGADEQRPAANLHGPVPQRVEPRVVRTHAGPVEPHGSCGRTDGFAGAQCRRAAVRRTAGQHHRDQQRSRRRSKWEAGSGDSAAQGYDPTRNSEGGAQRSVSLREREEIQELPRGVSQFEALAENVGGWKPPLLEGRFPTARIYPTKCTPPSQRSRPLT